MDRAREVARTCWAALAASDPETAKTIAWAATQAGEAWLTPQPALHGPEDLITPSEAAEMTGRSVRWVYAWVAEARESRAILGPDKRIRVRVKDLLESVALEH